MAHPIHHPGAFERTGEARPPKTPPFTGHSWGSVAASWRASNCSSLIAASITAFLAQDRLAISLRRPPDRTHRHMPGCTLSGTTAEAASTVEQTPACLGALPFQGCAD